MKRIGLISDTHGTFDDTLRGFLTDVDEIWHAGDIGSLELADRIAAFKPLAGRLRQYRRRHDAARLAAGRLLPVRRGDGAHDPHRRLSAPLRPAHPPAHPVGTPHALRGGHSHILRIIYDPVYRLLHLNPGGAGNYGIHKVRTALRFVVDGAEVRDMEIGEWPRSTGAHP